MTGSRSCPNPHTTKDEHDVNYGCWVIMMSQCRFIKGNKCHTLVGMLVMEEDVNVGWAGVCTESLLSVNFAVNLKLLPQTS